MFENYVIRDDAVHINLDSVGVGTDIVFHYDGKSFLVPGDSFFLVCSSNTDEESLCIGYTKGHILHPFVDAPRFS